VRGVPGAGEGIGCGWAGPGPDKPSREGVDGEGGAAGSGVALELGLEAGLEEVFCCSVMSYLLAGVGSERHFARELSGICGTRGTPATRGAHSARGAPHILSTRRSNVAVPAFRYGYMTAKPAERTGKSRL